LHVPVPALADSLPSPPAAIMEVLAKLSALAPPTARHNGNPPPAQMYMNTRTGQTDGGRYAMFDDPCVIIMLMITIVYTGAIRILGTKQKRSKVVAGSANQYNIAPTQTILSLRFL
jgi:hypothetical protein